MSKTLYHILKYFNGTINRYCINYILSLPEEEQFDMLNEEQRIDIECQEFRIKNCKHKWISICEKCNLIKEKKCKL
jgi:hypothetical protein